MQDGFQVTRALRVGSPINGGTDGSILFIGNGGISEDNANLFWDDTNDRLGIGTSSPAFKVDIRTDNTTNAVLFIESDGGAQNYMLSRQDRGVFGVSNNLAMWFVQNNQPRMKFTSGSVVFNDNANDYDFRIEGIGDQNTFFVNGGTDSVGIGNTNPQARFQVNTGGSTDTGIIIKGAASQTGNLQEWQDSSSNVVGGVESNGRLFHPGTFGEIYVHDSSTAQSIATGATYTKSTAWTTDGQSANCTNAAASDKITLTKTGRYFVSCSCSGKSGTANVNFLGSVFWNGVEQDQIHWRRKFGTANDEGSMSCSGIVDVTSASTDLDFRLRHDNGGAVNFTMTYGNLTIHYLGET